MFSTTTSTILFSLLSLSNVLAAPHAHDHAHEVTGSFAKKWFQEPDSPATKLFRRAPGDPVGSSGWQSNYPQPYAVAGNSTLLSAWRDRMNAVVSNPTFPNFGPTQLNGGYPLYTTLQGQSLDPHDPSVCSFTYGCRTPLDIDHAPDGYIGLTFDDGPTQYSDTLYDFLGTNNLSQKATHFLIGSNIWAYSPEFKRILAEGGQIAVHTWSHQYMTTLTNEQIVAELGWTMQIIYDASGLVPAFWRPPYGDTDNRVRILAMEVFGLRTVTWNMDTADWAVGSNPNYTIQSVESAMTKAFSGSKSPGLVMLEHELNANTVQIFKDMYPTMASNGWQLATISDIYNLAWYQNAVGNSTNPPAMNFIQSAAPGNQSAYSTNGPAATSSSVSSSVSANTSTVATSTIAAVNAVSSASGSMSTIAVTTHASASATAKTGAAAKRVGMSSLTTLGVVAVAMICLA